MRSQIDDEAKAGLASGRLRQSVAQALRDRFRIGGENWFQLPSNPGVLGDYLGGNFGGASE